MIERKKEAGKGIKTKPVIPGIRPKDKMTKGLTNQPKQQGPGNKSQVGGFFLLVCLCVTPKVSGGRHIHM